jgi:hypothetical protein
MEVLDDSYLLVDETMQQIFNKRPHRMQTRPSYYSGIGTQKRRESRASPCVANKVYLNLGNPQAGRLHLESLTASLGADG